MALAAWFVMAALVLLVVGACVGGWRAAGERGERSWRQRLCNHPVTETTAVRRSHHFDDYRGTVTTSYVSAERCVKCSVEFGHPDALAEMRRKR